MLSSENARILKWVKNHDRCFFSDDASIPDWITDVRLDHLIDEGFLRSIKHPSGVALYMITPRGEDTIEDRRWSLFLSIVSLIISALSLFASFTAVAISLIQLP